MPKNQRTSRPNALTLLGSGAVEIQGRLPWSSNGTFLVTVCSDSHELVAVYKPLRGERPLWDFPDGLYRREVAAYELDCALGWGFVPETIVRHDAPLDVGSLQRFVDADFEQHYFTLLEQERHRPALKRMAVFDVLANNADRKGGHCLLGTDGTVWGIDHGLCFHTEPKLRTVIWDFAGEPLDDAPLTDLDRFARRRLPQALATLLHDDEQDALLHRARALLRMGALPEPRSRRHFPWPLV